MRVGVPKERAAGERRAAAVPATVATYVEWGWEVAVERDAGVSAGFPDAHYADAGAEIVAGSEVHHADLVLRVGPPMAAEIVAVAAGATVVGFLEPYTNRDVMAAFVDAGSTAVAVEAIPRTTLAQSMDALSSQANLAGYAAVLLAAEATPKLLPMMVTAAGTIPPSRALILGVGVAGLQAIATAKRLGAVVHAYDIRTETKEQVESLGAKFVEAPTTEADAGGYAQEVEADVATRQHEALAPFVAEADIIVTTAQIPGRPAPRLVTDAMIATMKPGSVIVDMAADTGGNVEGSLPDEVVTRDGVSIHGPTNLVSSVPADASRMYARNLVNLLERLRDEESGGLAFDFEDEIVAGATVVHQGEPRHPRTIELLGGAAT